MNYAMNIERGQWDGLVSEGAGLQPDNLSLICSTHVAEWKQWLMQTVLWSPHTLSCMSISVLTRQINKCNCLESKAIEMATLSAGGKKCVGLNVSCLSVSLRKSTQLEEAGQIFRNGPGNIQVSL